MPLHAEEKLFIEAIRDLNFQASRLQAEENATIEDDSAEDHVQSASQGDNGHTPSTFPAFSASEGGTVPAASTIPITATSRLFPHIELAHNDALFSSSSSSSVSAPAVVPDGPVYE